MDIDQNKSYEEQIRSRISSAPAKAEEIRLQIEADGFDVRVVNDQAERIANENASVRSRYFKLTKLVDAATSIAQPYVACRNGCSSCCNIPVQISEFEAKRLAEYAGRTIEAPPAIDQAYLEVNAKFTGVPCPFLSEGKCSVYEVRPMACRSHIALHEDDFLCGAKPLGRPDVRIYSLNLTGVHFANLILSNKGMVGDIREFFPG